MYGVISLQRHFPESVETVRFEMWRHLQVFIVWIDRGAARVADLRSQDTDRGSEQGIGAPEAAHAKCGRFEWNINMMLMICVAVVVLQMTKENPREIFAVRSAENIPGKWRLPFQPYCMCIKIKNLIWKW